MKNWRGDAFQERVRQTNLLKQLLHKNLIVRVKSHEARTYRLDCVGAAVDISDACDGDFQDLLSNGKLKIVFNFTILLL